jgi:glycosyltransferase involved in cell wall biosynthesis
MPAITVIIPTHNRPHILPRAVDSARLAGADIEILVVDDASTDETAIVCRNLSGIKYIRLERNQGVAGARNVGILASESKYVTFLDDDDLRLPGSLDAQAKALETNPEAGFVCGALIMADQNYQPTGEVVRPTHSGGDVFWEILEFSFPVMGLSTLIRKDCLLHTGLLHRHLSGIDDWDIFARIAELYPALVMDQAVGLYRYPTPASAQGSSTQAAQLRRVAHHQLQLLKLPRALAAPASKRRLTRRRAVNRIADTLLWNAARSLPSGEFGTACANIMVALRLNPLRAVRPGAYKKLAERLCLKSQAVGR